VCGRSMLLMGLAAVLLTGPSEAGPVKAAASIHPISAIVREIGGDSVEVTTIVPPGTDPHHFELTPRTARAIYEADVIFLIGDHFDQWVLPGEGKDLEGCLIVRFHEDFSESLLAMGHTFNPHFWLDPLYAKSIGSEAAGALCSVNPTGCAYYGSRAEAFGAEIDSLHASIRSRLEESGFSDFVSFHPAWSYFAERYGLNEHGTLEISHEQEPSAKHIGGVIKEMIRSGVEFIVVEEFSNPDLAESVASETGARIVSLDPLGGPGTPGRATYVGLLDHNVSVIEKAVREE
jgi:ABC-type Zn uptake system ZnuABC Zn-binding protein ZnuA